MKAALQRLILWSLLSLSTVGLSARAYGQSISLPSSRAMGQDAKKPDLPRSRTPSPFKIERPSAESATDDPSFLVEQIRIDGSTGLSPKEQLTLTQPLTGRAVKLSELKGLADQISALYAARGYALTVAIVPVQTVIDGVVRITVIEGAIDQVDVEFKQKLSVSRANQIASAVRKRLRSVVQSGPVRTYDLERSILGIDDLSGLSASVIIRPSKTVEGSADLLVVIDRQALELEVSSDDRLRREFGSKQAALSVSASSLALIGDRLDLSYRRSQIDGAYDYRAIGYGAPIGNSLSRIQLSLSEAKTQAANGFLKALEFEGLERTARLGVQVPLYRSRVKSLYLNLDLAALDSSSDLFGATLIKDRVRTAEVGLSYDWADRSGASSLLELSYVKGLTGLEATDSDNVLRSRSYGSAEASSLNARLYRLQPVMGLDLTLDLAGQVVTRGQSLWASAECSFGGQVYGRGFETGLLGGDSCIKASVELSKPFQISRFRLVPYLFADGARVGQNGPLEFGEVREAIATSAGAGLRLTAPAGLSLDVQYARPQENPAPSMPRDGRWFFTLGFKH